MERETKTFTTPISGDNVVIKTYLTGREKRALTNIFLDNKGLNFDIQTEQVTGIDYSVVDKAQDLSWRTVVVSINGKENCADFDIVEFILDMRSEDHDFVVEQVNSVSSEKAANEKKTT